MRKITRKILFVIFLMWHQVAVADIERIDGSTVEKFEWSIKEVHTSLSPEEVLLFNKGLWDMIINHYSLAHGTFGLKKRLLYQRALDAAHITMHDVPVTDILMLGKILDSVKKITTKRKEKEKEKESNEDRMAAEVICLNEKIEIVSGDVKVNHRSTYYTYDIVFLIKNKMNFAISGISFDYALRQPDRSVAWAKENKYHSFKGGIEVGEERPVAFSITESPYSKSDKTILSIDFTDARDSSGATVVVHYSNVEKSEKSCRTTIK